MAADHVTKHELTLRELVRDVTDYPVEGVTFRDITPLLGDAAAFSLAVDGMVDGFDDLAVDRVVGVEARGFVFGAAVALRIGAGFVPVRKPGKLPWAVVREEYELEYGSDKLEIHRDAIHPGERPRSSRPSAARSPGSGSCSSWTASAVGPSWAAGR